MAIYFLDVTNGSDSKDGKSSVSCTFAGKTLNYVSGTYTIVDAGLAAAIEDGDIIVITSATAPAQSAQWEVNSIDGDIVTFSLYSGTWVASSRTDCVCSSGPFKTLAKLLQTVTALDSAYLVGSTGTLTQIYRDPQCELVALALKLRIESITVANGYAVEVSEVLRVPVVAVPIPEDKQVVLIQDSDRLADESAASQEHHKMTFILALTMRADETDQVAKDTYANRFHAAVRKALINDHTLSGTCIDLEVGDYEQMDNEQAVAVYALNVTATYRHTDIDPYPA